MNLKQLIQKTGLTQRAFAARVGFNSKVISHWIGGSPIKGSTWLFVRIVAQFLALGEEERAKVVGMVPALKEVE